LGKHYGVKCTSCNYSISVKEGVGMMYSPHAVFYGCCNDESQNWSIAFPDGLCEPGRPLLEELVRSKDTKERAFSLLEAGAIPTDDYGHELYVCRKCHHLFNRFYFRVQAEDEEYEPDYRCSHCKTLLKRADLKPDHETLRVVYRNNKDANWHCPQCGNERLQYDGFMLLWD